MYDCIEYAYTPYTQLYERGALVLCVFGGRKKTDKCPARNAAKHGRIWVCFFHTHHITHIDHSLHAIYALVFGTHKICIEKATMYLRGGPQAVIVGECLDASGLAGRNEARLITEINTDHRHVDCCWGLVYILLVVSTHEHENAATTGWTFEGAITFAAAVLLLLLRTRAIHSTQNKTCVLFSERGDTVCLLVLVLCIIFGYVV